MTIEEKIQERVKLIDLAFQGLTGGRTLRDGSNVGGEYMKEVISLASFVVERVMIDEQLEHTQWPNHMSIAKKEIN